MDRSIELAEVGFPSLDAAQRLPRIAPEEYERRMEQLAGAVDADWIVVYGDREHLANLAFLCGYDPRFEEALLVLGRGRRWLIVGTEGVGYSGVVPMELELIQVPTFSLMGIDRTAGRTLAEAFDACGIARGERVGFIGWKVLEAREWSGDVPPIVAPAFIVDALRAAVGSPDRVFDATPVLMAVDGLRLRNSADQIAVFEWGASRSSAGVARIIQRARAGVPEEELFHAFDYRGEPLLYHPILTSGPDIPLIIRSPTGRIVEKGDPVFLTVGMWGGNCGRAGMLAAGQEDLRPDNPDFLGRVAIPYWRTVVAWWEMVRIGARGGDLHQTLSDLCREFGSSPYLNTGHQQDWEDWPNTPFRNGAEERIASGMTLAVDIWFASNGPTQVIHCEDTVAIADEELRAEIRERHADVWARIEARQRFVREQLGIQAPDEILPLTVIPAYLPPFWLSSSMALRVVG